MTLRTYANGTEAELEYDDASQLTKLVNSESDDDVISSFEYEYDKAGASRNLGSVPRFPVPRFPGFGYQSREPGIGEF